MKNKIIYFHFLLVLFGYNQLCIAQTNTDKDYIAENSMGSLVLNKGTENQIKAYNNFFEQHHKRHIDELIQLFPSRLCL